MRKLATIVLGLILGGLGAIAAEAAPKPADQQPRTMEDVVDRVITNENRAVQQIRQYSPLVETYIQNLKPDKDLPADTRLWAALQAINEPHDVCLCLGDLVDYGLQPRQCIDWVRKHAQHTVRGNHDHGVAQHIQVSGRSGFKYLTTVTRPLTQELLTPEERRYLGRLPITKRARSWR